MLYEVITPAVSVPAPAPGSGGVRSAELMSMPAARKRGMKTVCWYEDVWRNDVPGIEKVQEVDLYGRRASRTCMNNPDHSYNFV